MVKDFLPTSSFPLTALDVNLLNLSLEKPLSQIMSLEMNSKKL